jgi:hypothetical protein
MGEAPSEAAPSVYNPNFKFKVQDAEHEMDEFIRAAIKDAETEKKARELYQKAYGLDVIKPKLQKTREELESVRGEYTPIKEAIAELRNYVQADDFDNFFRGLNIPENKVMQWVAKKLQYEGLSPEDKKRYDSEVQLRRENLQLQRERETLGSKNHEAETRLLQLELDMVLQAPETNQAMRDFDARLGKVGAFKEYVIQHAQALEASTGRSPSPKEAVEAVTALVGRIAGQPAQQNTPPQVASQDQQTKPPVIPNIKSRGGSPVKKTPSSIDDLRAIAKERIKELNG